jgi:hypothetical protein
MEFVYVKGGVFQMGDTFGEGQKDEKPVHKVVDDFYIGKYLVTEGIWQKIMGNISGSKKGYYYPVTNISWNDVQKFIGELNQETRRIFRLPTEAEWEYAARSGGKKEKWAATNNISELTEYAWYAGNSGMEPHPVGGKRPNELGLYDMSGNVCEWVQDLYDKDYYGYDLKGDLRTSRKERVYRGGSWNSEELDLRVSKRFKGQPDGLGGDLGFRLAFSAQHKKLFTTEKDQLKTSEDKIYGTPQPKMTHIMEVQAQIASEAKKYDSPTPSLHKPLYKPPQVQGDANQPNATARTAKAGPTGIGGWLMLLVLGMMVLGPLLGVGRLATDLTSVERQYPQITNLEVWKTYKSVAWCAFILFAAVLFYGGWGLARGKDWSVVSRAKAILWITGPIAAIVLGLGIPIAIFGEAAFDAPEFISGLIVSGIAAGIWTAYLSKSKRVRNTYGGSGR